MRKISKILAISVMLSSSLFANDKDVINFEKQRISQNPNVKLIDVKINNKKDVPIPGWSGYVLDVKANMQGKDIDVKDILFSNGKYITFDLFDLQSGKSLKDMMVPSVDSKYYNKTKLIAGNENAPYKIVLFSDPLCPFCMDYVPDVIKHTQKNSDLIALYYYHFPLTRIHPAAVPLSKLAEIASKKGVKDVKQSIYTTNWDDYFDSKSMDEKKILDSFNKVFKTSITLDELRDPKIDELIRNDIKMGEDVMVQGTPTIFINGERDNQKDKFLTIGKR